jgi:hypothetical protein
LRYKLLLKSNTWIEMLIVSTWKTAFTDQNRIPNKSKVPAFQKKY